MMSSHQYEYGSPRTTVVSYSTRTRTVATADCYLYRTRTNYQTIQYRYCTVEIIYCTTAERARRLRDDVLYSTVAVL